MRNIKILLIAILFSNTLLFSQFNKGEFTLSAGASVFNYAYLSKTFTWNNDYKFNIIPPVLLKAELGIHEYIGIGGFLGYNTRTYILNTNDNFKQNYKYYSIGGFASLHFTKFLEEYLMDNDLEVLDMYVTSNLRLELRDYTTSYEDESNSVLRETTSNSEIRFGLGFGMRYYFIENIALFAEVGTQNLGYFTIGGTLRF